MRRLFKLAWPIIVSRSTQAVIGLADTVMVAHLGAVSLASVTTGALNSFSLLIVPIGTVFIISSFSSQLYGRGEALAARRYGWYGLIIAAAAHVLALLSLPLIEPAMASFGHAPEVAAGLAVYMKIRLLSTLAAVGIEALGNYYAGLGDTKILMRVNTTAMLLNVALNKVLIDGMFGLPALGARGAAWASVLATSVAFLGFFIVFWRDGYGREPVRLVRAEFLEVLRFGLPSGANWGVEFFAFLAFVNIVVGGIGTVSLAAMMAVVNLSSVAFMPALGLASAGAILVGQVIGYGRKRLVPGLTRMTFATAAGWMSLVGIVYLVVPGVILAPFVPGGADAEAFRAVGTRMLVMSALWQVFDAGSIVYTEVLRAAGDTTFPMWARGLIAWGVFLPGSWLHVRVYGGGEVAAMGWLVAYLGLLFAALFLRFRSGAWSRIALVSGSART